MFFTFGKISFWLMVVLSNGLGILAILDMASSDMKAGILSFLVTFPCAFLLVFQTISGFVIGIHPGMILGLGILPTIIIVLNAPKIFGG